MDNLNEPTVEYYQDGVNFGTGFEMIREITRLRADNAVLREALGPFAKIEPSSFFPADGSEEEGYVVILDAKDEDVGISGISDFTGLDLHRARAALSVNEDFMCQADDSAKGDAVSAKPLQSNDSGDAENE